MTKNQSGSHPTKSRNSTALDKLCEEYKDIFPIHQGDIGHTKMLPMDVDMGDHPLIAQKLYTLLLKHT